MSQRNFQDEMLEMLGKVAKADGTFNPQEFLSQVSSANQPTRGSTQSQRPTPRPGPSSYFYTGVKPKVAEWLSRKPDTKAETASLLLNATDDLRNYLSIVGGAKDGQTNKKNFDTYQGLEARVYGRQDTNELRKEISTFNDSLVDQLTAKGEDPYDAKA